MPSPTDTEDDKIGKNIAAVREFYSRDERNRSALQRAVEGLSAFVGRPSFLALILACVAGWIAANLGLPKLGLAAFDPAPFFWLQGVVGLGALLIGTVVLSKQNRLAKLSEQRAHLDLKVSLLTEQKVAKLIDLLEELRRDLPDVRDRHDSHAMSLQQAMSPDRVLAALDEGRAATADGAKPGADAAPDGAGPMGAPLP